MSLKYKKKLAKNKRITIIKCMIMKIQKYKKRLRKRNKKLQLKTAVNVV